MLDAMMMLKYWSHMIRLRKMHITAVLPTMATAFFVRRNMLKTMLSSIFEAVIAAPKIMAHTMSQMVLIMPAMPLVETSELSISLPVSMLVSPYIIVSKPMTVLLTEVSPVPAISSRRSGWAMRAATHAMMTERKRKDDERDGECRPCGAHHVADMREQRHADGARCHDSSIAQRRHLFY